MHPATVLLFLLSRTTSVLSVCIGNGSNCRRGPSLSTGGRIAIGVAVGVAVLLVLACVVIRQCILRRRFRQQQRVFSLAPPPAGATAASNYDGASASGMVGDGRYPQSYYPSNTMNNMKQNHPNTYNAGINQGAGRVPPPPPSYDSGINSGGRGPYNGNTTGAGGFNPPAGAPPNFDGSMKL